MRGLVSFFYFFFLGEEKKRGKNSKGEQNKREKSIGTGWGASANRNRHHRRRNGSIWIDQCRHCALFILSMCVWISLFPHFFFVFFVFIRFVGQSDPAPSKWVVTKCCQKVIADFEMKVFKIIKKSPFRQLTKKKYTKTSFCDWKWFPMAITIRLAGGGAIKERSNRNDWIKWLQRDDWELHPPTETPWGLDL